MKKLFYLALVCVSAWYGWTHRDKLFHPQGSHEAVVENNASCSIERLRITVDGQTLVKESLPSKEAAVIPFTINDRSDFQLVWQWGDRPGERRWHGGSIESGAALERHIFQIDDAGSVRHYSESKPMAARD